MKVWALWSGPAKDMKLVALYESYDDAQQEKDAIMDETRRKYPPVACSVIEMETIAASGKESA